MTDAERWLQDKDRENLIRTLTNKITSEWYEMGLFRSCYNCEHWLEGPPDNRLQKCGKFNARPPTKIIVCGCDQHTDNINIPY